MTAGRVHIGRAPKKRPEEDPSTREEKREERRTGQRGPRKGQTNQQHGVTSTVESLALSLLLSGGDAIPPPFDSMCHPKTSFWVVLLVLSAILLTAVGGTFSLPLLGGDAFQPVEICSYSVHALQPSQGQKRKQYMVAEHGFDHGIC